MHAFKKLIKGKVKNFFYFRFYCLEMEKLITIDMYICTIQTPYMYTVKLRSCFINVSSGFECNEWVSDSPWVETNESRSETETNTQKDKVTESAQVFWVGVFKCFEHAVTIYVRLCRISSHTGWLVYILEICVTSLRQKVCTKWCESLCLTSTSEK